MDIDTIWLLPIRLAIIRQYPTLSESIRSDIIRFYPNTYPKKILLCIFNYIFCIHYKSN
jgi:hypothetical protein